jgi:hypothetical protein
MECLDVSVRQSTVCSWSVVVDEIHCKEIKFNFKLSFGPAIMCWECWQFLFLTNFCGWTRFMADFVAHHCCWLVHERAYTCRSGNAIYFQVWQNKRRSFMPSNIVFAVLVYAMHDSFLSVLTCTCSYQVCSCPARSWRPGNRGVHSMSLHFLFHHRIQTPLEEEETW